MAKPPQPFRRFEPLASTVKDRFFLCCILLAILLAVDWAAGSPAISYILRLQYKWQEVDPERQSTVISSFFGRYDSVLSLARTMDRAGTIFFSAISGILLLRGFLRSIFNEPTA